MFKGTRSSTHKRTQAGSKGMPNSSRLLRIFLIIVDMQSREESRIMERDDVPEDLSATAFEFFYWYSRFEFALKANGYLKSHEAGRTAEPGWNEFTDQLSHTYVLSNTARVLLDTSPERQVISGSSGLDWESVDLSGCKSDLAKVIRLVKTVRNNLFHGGKHGGAGWADPARSAFLLTTCKAVLDEIAKQASIEADYRGLY